MKASSMVLKEILDSPEAETGRLLEKYAGRYRDDGELQGICRLHLGGSGADEVRERLKSVYDARKLGSGGTRLQLEDRRRLREHRGMEDY